MLFKLTRLRFSGGRELAQAIVRAADETSARLWVSAAELDQRWLDQEFANCQTVEPNGPPEIISMEFDA